MDKAINPDHYKRFEGDPYECIKVIEAWQLDFKLGNCLKYLSRAGKKSKETEIEDLLKSIRYIELKIEELKRINENKESR